MEALRCSNMNIVTVELNKNDPEDIKNLIW